MTSTTFSPKPGGFLQSYRTALRQIRGVTILYTAILAVALPLLLIFTLAQARSQYLFYGVGVELSYHLSSQADSFMMASMIFFVLPLLWLFALIFTVTLFRYLHDKRSVDLYHSLPVRRENLLLGRLAAEITSLAAPFLAALLVCFLVLLIFGVSVDAATIWARALFFLLDTLALIALMIFFLVCCGTVFDAAVSTIAFCGGLPLLVLLSTEYVGKALPGYAGDSVPYALYRGMNPFLGAMALRNELTAPVQLWWLFYAAALLIAAVFLYRKRPSEAAENAFAFPIPRVLIRFLISASFGMLLGLLVYSIYPSFPFLISVLLGALLAHLAIETVYRRGVKGIWKTMRAYAVVVALFIVFTLVCSTGCFGYTTRIPAVDDVKYVTFTTSYGTDHTAALFTEDENGLRFYIASLESMAAESENIEQVIALHQDIIDRYLAMGPFYPMSEGSRFEVRYTLKDGTVLQRRFCSSGFPAGFSEKLEELSCQQEILENKIDCFLLSQDSFDSISLYNMTEEGKNYESLPLDAAQRAELLEALQNDYLSGNALNPSWGDYAAELSLTHEGSNSLPVSIEEGSALVETLSLPDSPVYLTGTSYPISKDSFPNTFQFLQELGVIS